MPGWQSGGGSYTFTVLNEHANLTFLYLHNITVRLQLLARCWPVCQLKRKLHRWGPTAPWSGLRTTQ